MDVEENNIIFEKIDKNYSYGKFGSIKIVLNNKGYVNITKLCTLLQTSKCIDNWRQTDIAQIIINEAFELNKSDCIESPSDLFIVVKCIFNPKITGTYAHCDLVPHIIRWISPKFAVKVSKIVNQFFINKIINEKDEIIKTNEDRLDKLIEEVKNDKIKFNAETKLLNQKIDDLIKLNKNTVEKKQQHIDSNMEDDVIIRKLTKSYETQNYKYLIYRDDTDKHFQYHAIRAMTQYVNQSIKTYLDNHPNGVNILEITCDSNVVNLHNKVKTELNDIISCKSNDFKIIKKGYTEKKLIETIQLIFS